MKEFDKNNKNDYVYFFLKSVIKKLNERYSLE